MKYVWQYNNWPDFKWQSERLLESLGKARFCQGRLLNRVRNLNISLTRKAQAEIMIEEAVKTSEIEGEKLARRSVKSSVARHLGLPNAGLTPVDRHIDGLIDVLVDATSNYNNPLSANRLKSWHGALFPTGFSGLRKIRVGKWRGENPMRVVSGSIGREKVHFEASPGDRVNKEMNYFLSWWKKSLHSTEGLLRAGIAHFHFITVHPFEDGNGRIARALTDMALAQDEKLATRFYSLSSKIMEERKDYYKILEHSQKSNGDITEWLLWFLGCFIRAIEKSQNIISNVLAKADFWQYHAQTIINTRQRKVINRLLDAGKGEFKGGLTTRKYVGMTKVSRATAYREISDLVNKKILKQTSGKGRSISYEITDF